MWLQPQGWSRQPANALGINYGHPLAQYLIFYAYPQGSTLPDLVTGNCAVQESGASITVKPWNAGTARQTDGGINCATTVSGGGVWRWGAGKTQVDYTGNNSGPMTLLSLSMSTTASTSPIHFSTSDNFNGYGFGIASDDNVFFGPGRILYGFNSNTVNGGAASVNNQLTSSPTSKMHFFGCAFTGFNFFSYYQGLFRSTGSSGAVITTSGAARQTQIGAMYSTGTSAIHCGLALAFNKVLTLDEYQRLWMNPWALVKPQTAKFFIGASGGTVYSGSVAESLSIADTPNATAIFVSAIAEVLTAVDTPAATAIFPVSVAETLNAVETQNSGSIFTADVAETLNAVDTTSTTVIFVGSVAEILTAIDSPNTTAILNVSRAEVLTAIDTSTGNLAGGGNTVTLLGGVSAYDDSGGVSKKIIKLTDLGGGLYLVTYTMSVNENKVDSVHNEWYIIT